VETFGRDLGGVGDPRRARAMNALSSGLVERLGQHLEL